MLAGDPPPSGQTAGPVTATDTAALGKSLTRIRGKVVIVKAGANPAAQAAAAAAIGARAVVIADPRRRPLPAMAAGRSAVPVIGVTGDAREELLKAKPGTEIAFGDTERGPTPTRRAGRDLAQHVPGTDRGRPAEARPRRQRQRAQGRCRRQGPS